VAIGGLAFLGLIVFFGQHILGVIQGRKVAQRDHEAMVQFAAHSGLSLYATDNDGRYPAAEQWMEASLPYAAEALQEMRSERLFRTPAASGPNEFGVAMNAAVSRAHVASLKEPNYLILVFASTDFSWNAHGGREKIRMTDSPLGPGCQVTLVEGSGTMVGTGYDFVRWQP